MKDNFVAFFRDYRENLSYALALVDTKEIKKAIDIISQAGTVYVAGNGGSAAISSHLCCDMTKGTQPERYIHTVSLMDNSALITAIANDYGYENTISYQLNTGFDLLSDVLLLISSSGKSPNIVKAAKEAKERGHKLISFTGFDGGLLRELSDAKIHVNSNNYGVIEDAHQAIMHCMAQYIKHEASLTHLDND